MKELGYGDQYKYNPNYKDGKVVQEYLPEELEGRKFLEDRDLGTEIDPGAWIWRGKGSSWHMCITKALGLET